MSAADFASIHWFLDRGVLLWYLVVIESSIVP